MKKLLASGIVTMIISSCNHPSPGVVSSVSPVDSLITSWSKNWNNHDSAGIRVMFTTDALLIDDNLIALNADEIAVKWIHPNLNAVSHFKTTALQDWFSNDRAGYTGRYEFDVIVNDSVVAKPHGVYTVNWVKAENGEWKITTAAIHSLTKGE